MCRWEEQEKDGSVPCSMEMELYCPAADCLIATQHRSCLQILPQTKAQVHVDAANIRKEVLVTLKPIYYKELERVIWIKKEQ